MASSDHSEISEEEARVWLSLYNNNVEYKLEDVPEDAHPIKAWVKRLNQMEPNRPRPWTISGVQKHFDRLASQNPPKAEDFLTKHMAGVYMRQVRYWRLIPDGEQGKAEK